ncbi:MAG TPA: hypothetical protein VMU41_08720 [Candidatus Binataceae bacterium]|nr:hypothetical protein [Candidatus Binataceae bacterium]
MELRMLTTDAERDRFAHHLREVRAMRGAGFSETARSLTGEVHLKFGNLYGLFDEHRSPNTMLGGFAMHDLGMFGQSFPRPDLSHLSPDKVFECGELWAAVAGAAPILRQAGLILAGQLNAEALLLYPIYKPWNLSTAYNKGFERMGDPVAWPYIHTLSGDKIWVQPMVSQGEALQQLIRETVAHQADVKELTNGMRFTTPYSISARSISERSQRNGRIASSISISDRVAA